MAGPMNIESFEVPGRAAETPADIDIRLAQERLADDSRDRLTTDTALRALGQLMTNQRSNSAAFQRYFRQIRDGNERLEMKLGKILEELKKNNGDNGDGWRGKAKQNAVPVAGSAGLISIVYALITAFGAR